MALTPGQKPVVYRAIVLWIVVNLTACSDSGSPDPSRASVPDPESDPAAAVTERDDTPDLRVIVRAEPVSFLPRNAEPVRLDREIARELADYLGMDFQPVIVEDYSEMIATLLAGDADVIAASMTVTGGRAEEVLFSIPYLHVDELLIVPAGEGVAAEWEGLDGKSVCVRLGSSYAETLEELQKAGTDVEAVYISAWRNTEEIIDMVAEGECAATVVDTHYWSSIKQFFDNIQALRPLAEDRPVALAVHPDDAELKQRIDHFLTERALLDERDYVFTDDLPELKQRRRLRMITRNTAVTYYLYRGAPFGFEYEMMKKFADQQDLNLEIVIPPDNESLIPWLNEGRGDVIAAMLTDNEQRRRRVAVTRPYFYSDEVVVVRDDDESIQNLEDLAGKTVHVRRSSSYYQTLLSIQEQVGDITIVSVPESTQTSEIMRNIESGEWDVTVANRELLQLEQTYGHTLKAALSVSDDSALSWMVRKENPELLNALNEFIAEEYRGLFYNMRKERYFENNKIIARAESEWRLDQSGNISPYDDLVKKYASVHELDWRLIVSQMYQESRFDHSRESWAGARGLMQLLPRAARDVGVKSLDTPEQSIKAGVRYLRRMIDLFDPLLPLEERIRFGLASYNAGRSHVLDARRLARQQGWSPNVWYGNVEQAMLLLSDPEYYENARFGFVRGEEPVNYVREIETRYRSYVRQLP